MWQQDFSWQIKKFLGFVNLQQISYNYCIIHYKIVACFAWPQGKIITSLADIIEYRKNTGIKPALNEK